MKYLLLAALTWTTTCFSQSITYSWLNQPCASMLNCEGGCSACNLAANSGAALMGNGMAWLGVDICPHPVVVGDNALLTYGWPATPDPDHIMILTGLALEPMNIDSVIIRHRYGADGPQRMLVKFGINESMPTTVVSDAFVPESFGTTVLTDLGLVQATPQQVFGFFSLTVQPYQGNGGSWDVDEIRIAASPAAFSAVNELTATNTTVHMPAVDMLGRRIGQQRSLGIFFDGRLRPVMR